MKRVVSQFLKSKTDLFYTMPVPSGFGESTLDYLGCYKGRFFGIETKKPGGKPTDRQKMVIEKIQKAGGAAFVIDGDISELKHWIDSLK